MTSVALRAALEEVSFEGRPCDFETICQRLAEREHDAIQFAALAPHHSSSFGGSSSSSKKGGSSFTTPMSKKASSSRFLPQKNNASEDDIREPPSAFKLAVYRACIQSPEFMKLRVTGQKPESEWSVPTF